MENEKQLSIVNSQLSIKKKGWEIKKLGEVCNFQNGFAFKSNTYKEEGTPIVRITNIQDEKLDLTKIVYIDTKDYNKDLSKYKIVKDDLLIAMSGATTGKIGIHKTDEILLLNQRVGKFEPKEVLNKSYLLNFLKTKVEESLAISAGAAQPNLSTQQIKAFEIPLPPLKEQQRIVALLDKAFTAIDQAKANAQQNLLNAKELFESYLQNVFVNGKLKVENGEWEEKTIGELGKPSMCKRIFKEQTSSNGEIPFYKIGAFGKKPNAFISKKIYEEYKTKYSFPKKGDILISASGTIGRRVVYDGKPAFFQDSNIVWIDNDECIVSNEYLYYFYGYCDWQPKKGATIPRLYNANLKKLIIPFPKSNQNQNQKKIVEKLNALQTQTKKLEVLYQQKIVDLEELKKSVLQKAFNGEL